MNFEISAPRPEKIEPYLEEFIRVESAGWKGRDRTALLFDERLRGIYYSYGKAAADRGIMRICILRVDDRAIAAALAVEESKRLWILKIGYDEKWIRCAPGILLVHETIRYAFGQGVEAYEFLGNEEPWIRRWTKQSHSYVTARVYPYTFQGLYGLVLDASRSIFMKGLKIMKIKG
jgi:CelD/BcsL family acetyltransferase involved in cellulose biosynthesis